MKRIPFLFAVVTALIVNFFAQRAVAQDAKPGTMTAEQATAVKAIKIANADKDTYFKTGGFILERYEDRPPYVFTYSDGITRKVYLYKIYSAADTKDLGLLALYQNGKTGESKSFVVPGTGADRKAWDAYLDDLKYVGEKEPGLMSAMTFALSREMATLLAGGTAKVDEGGKKKEEYNFCFGPLAPVILANGNTKTIEQVTVGEQIMAYDLVKKAIVPTRVMGTQKHEGQFALVGVWTMPVNELSADMLNQVTPPTLLEATENHPVLTATGRKNMSDVTVGETLYRYENGRLQPHRVIGTGTTGQRPTTVYSLTTQQGSYLIDGMVVLEKH
jgi:Hint module